MITLFMINRENISRALEETKLRDAFLARRGDTAQPADEENADDEQDRRITIKERLVNPLVDSIIDDEPSIVFEPLGEQNNIIEDEETQDTEPQQIPEVAEEIAQPARETATATIYFIQIDSHGTIFPMQVNRITEKTPAPLTRSMQLLINGLTNEEDQQGLLNLIPAHSRLLSAEIKNSIAYLNFNEAFRYNSYGAEGSIAQLLQIVYSVTEFNSVEAVQILIEGGVVDYLNSDSRIYIGKPIRRDFLGQAHI